ncbi:MAG TPA: RNA polymerase sigma factor, partial [Thermoanaerobaculia bacterium]|nr:RNA polymerase sigma factor [Thermoanaerobaculia bacterium]
LRYVRRLTGSRSDAEEIVQETFLKLHQRLTQEEGELTNARAWLFRVATNAARDLERERRVRTREGHLASNDMTVVDFEAHLERRQLTRAALRRIPRRMRQVLLLWSEGFTYREIADIAGIEPGYVGVLLQRARAAFRREYEQLELGDPGRKNNGLL